MPLALLRSIRATTRSGAARTATVRRSGLSGRSGGPHPDHGGLRDRDYLSKMSRRSRYGPLIDTMNLTSVLNRPMPVLVSTALRFDRLSLPAFLLTSVFLIGCAASPVTDYSSDAREWRERRDADFRNDRENSPIKSADLDRFLPLAYYPPDESYAIPAGLTPADGTVTLEMSAPGAKPEQMHLAGTLRFSLDGQIRSLAAFLDSSNQLLVPFTDPTNGVETYKAGRYVNLSPTATGIYSLDFNRAYFPSCYYDSSYICPLPPKQNHVDAPIRAGERMRESHSAYNRSGGR